ncbi:hypothetical protein C2S53_001126 [Perilla frutescens var. hirtella]|uniref:EF-hand domain-containing protein n=1 Tax=Perilla frutescens var. hirtella TaxID=608512 RepID=A0AAD4PEL1_PERFH|nr:hypothetical protein C2S53_001126 [Perilla frutescens var. hirtella]
MILRSLGISCQEKLLFPAKLDAAVIFDIFEKREPSLDEVREAFDVFDDNIDGFIDENELQRVVYALGPKEGLKVESCRRMIWGGGCLMKMEIEGLISKSLSNSWKIAAKATTK